METARALTNIIYRTRKGGEKNMVKRLIVGLLGLTVVAAGIATFAANTAQWVNVTAHVEKEIEIACVVRNPDWTPTNKEPFYIVDRDGCDYGVVFPENSHEKVIEVTLSNSFYNQNEKSAVKYWVLWECKLQDEQAPFDEDTNICREDIAHTDKNLCYSTVHGKWLHCNNELDGNIADYIKVTAGGGCLDKPYTGPSGGDAKLRGLGDGIVDKDAAPKCIYHLDFLPPACRGHINYATDPLPNPKVVDCHEIIFDKDPQNWDRFVDLGDSFKIQVYAFSLD